MASPAAVAAKAAVAHEKVMEVIEAHGSAERAQNLGELREWATVKNPYHLMSAQAEMLASLAEIVEAQERRLAGLEKEAAKPKAAKAK